MTLRRKIASGVSFILIFSTLSYAHAAPPKAGSVCKKVGKKQISGGKTFTCVKSGKKLVWDKGVKLNSGSNSPQTTNKPEIKTPATSSETRNTSKPLPVPEISSINFSGTTLFVSFFVSSESLGGFITIEELGVYKSQTITPKSTDGLVKIKVTFKTPFPRKIYDILFHAYSEGAESPCCSGVSQELEFRTEEDRTTKPSNNSEINEFINPSVASGKPTTVLTPSREFLDTGKCKLLDGDPELTNMTIGFPIPKERVDLNKSPVIQILPVAFTDIPSETNPIEDYKNGIGTMTKFWESQSFTGSTIEVRSPKTYRNLPNPVLSYGLASDLDKFQSDNYAKFVQLVIDLYDPEVDFSAVSAVVVVVPLSTSKQQIGTWVVDTQREFKSAEKNIYNYMLTGNGVSKNQSSAWVHEFGHALGLTDMRFVDPVTPTIQKPEGLGVFDIMGSGNAAPEILVWSRFLLGILAPGQIHCITAQTESTHWITPLPQQNINLKGLIIPTGTYTALVVESRRGYGFDSMLAKRDEGALVYRVDTRIPYKRSPMQIIQPARSADKEWYTDSALRLNEYVVSDGWKISVVETGDFGDVIRVERI